MTETVLFVGWGMTHPGREQLARKTYAEFIEILGTLKAEREIDGFETFMLAPHAGELDGFTLIYGTPEKLAELPMREDLHRLRMRAHLDHAKFSVIQGVAGGAVERELSLLEEIAAEYEREPALV